MTFSHLKKVSVCFGEEKNTDGVSKLCKDILPSHRAPYSLFPIEINKKTIRAWCYFNYRKNLFFDKLKEIVVLIMNVVVTEPKSVIPF
jgi:hypothetical protein